MIAQTSSIERKFEFNFPLGLFSVIVERLRGCTPRIKALVAGKPEKLLGSAPHGWSVKEHIGHLYDLEELWFGRIEDFLSGAKTLRAADMTNEKTHNAD